MNGSALATSGTARAVLHDLSGLAIEPSWPQIETCGLKARMRSRRSSSKPVITASMMVSVITPMAIPAVEISVISEMNASRRLARR